MDELKREIEFLKARLDAERESNRLVFRDTERLMEEMKRTKPTGKLSRKTCDCEKIRLLQSQWKKKLATLDEILSDLGPDDESTFSLYQRVSSQRNVAFIVCNFMNKNF